MGKWGKMGLLILLLPHVLPHIRACPWKELLPSPQHGCTRLFHRLLHVHETSAFLIYAPPTERCSTAESHIACPSVPWPTITNESASIPKRAQPPAFYKLSLQGAKSFIHVAEMEPTANENYYVFSLQPIEQGPVNVSLNVDFEGCEGRDMLSMNVVDLHLFSQRLITHHEVEAAMVKQFAPENSLDTRFRGCRKMVFRELLPRYTIQVHARTQQDVTLPACDWSLLRGGWWLNYDGTPAGFESRCRPYDFTDWLVNVADQFPQGTGSQSLQERINSLKEQVRSRVKKEDAKAAKRFTATRFVCVIGDSHINQYWSKVISPRTPTNAEFYVSGGGIEMDIGVGGSKMYSWNEPNDGSILKSFEPQLQEGLKIGASGRRYSVPDLLRTHNTSGIVESVLVNLHNPWSSCVGKEHPKTDTIIFHSGSHNCGASAFEGKESVRQIVDRFDQWKSTGNKKCLLLIASNDLHHEAVSTVKNGKFGEQAHFRNSFRVASLNRAMRDAVLEQKQRWLERNSSHEPLNVHFIDTFHLSVGLHWLGHWVRPKPYGTDPMLDPVHFNPQELNKHFADLVFDATKELCDR